MRKQILIAICTFVGCVSASMPLDFEVSVTNALRNKSVLISDEFTNYIFQCANQNTNVEESLTAGIILGVSRLEMFNETIDRANLDAAFQAVSNTLNSCMLATNQWQYWQMAIVHISCLNTANNAQGTYLVASNAWAAIQHSGFEDSTNVMSRALLAYHGVGSDVTIKAAIALHMALAADAVGKQTERDALKVFLPDRLKHEMEAFLSDE